MLAQHLTYGDEAILLGQIVAVSVDKEAFELSDLYKYLQMLVFLEDGTYSVIEQAWKLNSASRS